MFNVERVQVLEKGHFEYDQNRPREQTADSAPQGQTRAQAAEQEPGSNCFTQEIQQGIIDEEEYEIIIEIKDLKKQYKLQSEQLKEAKSKLVYLDQIIQKVFRLLKSKQSLLNQFEQWFLKKYGIRVQDLDNVKINQLKDDVSSDSK